MLSAGGGLFPSPGGGGGGLSGSAGGFIGVSSLAGILSGVVSVDPEPPHACKIKRKTKEKVNKYLRFLFEISSIAFFDGICAPIFMVLL